VAEQDVHGYNDQVRGELAEREQLNAQLKNVEMQLRKYGVK
jgi:predicted Ser/Thr protein kinase